MEFESTTVKKFSYPDDMIIGEIKIMVGFVTNFGNDLDVISASSENNSKLES